MSTLASTVHEASYTGRPPLRSPRPVAPLPRQPWHGTNPPPPPCRPDQAPPQVQPQVQPQVWVRVLPQVLPQALAGQQPAVCSAASEYPAPSPTGPQASKSTLGTSPPESSQAAAPWPAPQPTHPVRVHWRTAVQPRTVAPRGRSGPPERQSRTVPHAATRLHRCGPQHVGTAPNRAFPCG